MTKSFLRLSCVAISLFTIIPATSASEYKEIETIRVSEQGDLEKSCNALSREALHMRETIHAMQHIKDTSEMQSHGITAAGAVGSFLIGSVTGGIGLAVGGLLLDYNVGENEEAADDVQDIAKQRRTLMTGIYNAKGCFGPIEHAMQDPKDENTFERLASTDGPVYHAELRKRYND